MRAIASGAYDFYQKPVDIDELGMIVKRAFHLHAIEADNARLAASPSADATVLGGMVTAGYTVPAEGAAPALGWSGLSADGEGGVQADADGSTYLVVDVDTTAKTVTFVL